MRYPFNKYGVLDFIYKIKWAWQRAVRGYDDTAFWGLAGYVTDIALPVLKKYRKDKTGVPLLEGFGGEKDWDKMQKEWYKILDKMILSFQLIKDDEEGVMNVWDRKLEIDEGLALFAKHFVSLWD